MSPVFLFQEPTQQTTLHIDSIFFNIDVHLPRGGKSPSYLLTKVLIIVHLELFHIFREMQTNNGTDRPVFTPSRFNKH